MLVALALLAIGAGSAAGANPPPPVATTGSATELTYESAVLGATVNPEGASTEVYFEYGTTTAYGTSSAQVAVAAGTKAVPVTISISGLAAYTTYDYRVFAVSANGTSKGLNGTFKTAKIPLTLAVSADPSPVNYDGNVTIEGTLAGTDNANRAVALQQTQFPYTAAFAQVGNSELTSATGAYAFIVPAVIINTEYRVVNVDNPLIVSSVVDEGCAVLATLHGKAIGTRAHRATKFTGTVTPGVETGAHLAIQKLNGTNWDLVGGGQTSRFAHNGVTTFSVKVYFRQAGFFRVLVEPVEGAHVTGQSNPIYARGY
jgi:hypothetical protein